MCHETRTCTTGTRTRRNATTTTAAKVLLLLLGAATHSGLQGQTQADDTQTGLRAPPGFRVSLFADDHLAHDVFSLTHDARGRVVVSGPGYVHILEDRDADGRADHAIPFADGPADGAQGLYFDGSDLYFTGDGGLRRYRDDDRDDRADGPSELILAIHTGGEHHAHAVAKGPDGAWYLIAGNYAGVNQTYVISHASPVRRPEAGALLRIAPDFQTCEVVAHGLRNAYRFDFHPSGAVFTYDSDDERDLSLPWYRQTRLLELLPGAHYGWQAFGWKRPDYFIDMVPAAAELGRGSPTGVVCYRHTRFPDHYHGAFFLLDWTYGRIWCCRPQPTDDGLLRADPTLPDNQTPSPLGGEGSRGGAAVDHELFLHAAGDFGFAPTDASVGPDGSLYVSVGGRGTRGGVYRIDYLGNQTTTGVPPLPNNAVQPAQPEPSDTPPLQHDPLARCLRAPQPQASWSRAVWQPLARSLPPEAFVEAALDPARPEHERIRAIEILVEVFGGVPTHTAEPPQPLQQQAPQQPAPGLRELLQCDSPTVRARVAWALGRSDIDRIHELAALRLADDQHPLVRRAALETLARDAAPENAGVLVRTIAERFDDHARTVRQAAARLAVRLSPENWNTLQALIETRPTRPQLTAALAAAWRSAPGLPNTHALAAARLALFEDDPALQLEACRIIQLALGDFAVQTPLGEAYASYVPAAPVTPGDQSLTGLLALLGSRYPSGTPELDAEIARLFALLESDDPELLLRVARQIGPDSHPGNDLHHLLVLSRLRAPRPPAVTAHTARALLELDRKLAERNLATDRHWPLRIAELFPQLIDRDPALPRALIADPEFGRPDHVLFAALLDPALQAEAGRRLIARAAADQRFHWSPNVVRFLGTLPPAEFHPHLRRLWDRQDLRDAIVLSLARAPQAEDVPRFVAALASGEIETIAAAAAALAQLPPDQSPETALQLVRAARRLGRTDPELQARDAVMRVLERLSGRNFGFVHGPEGHRPQTEAVARAAQWFQATYPQHAEQLLQPASQDLEGLRARLAQVPWDQGDPQRGRTLFVARSCHHCHGGDSAATAGLGPDLRGVTGRFSREDLFLAIAIPDRDVSPQYQTTLIETTAGRVHQGMVIYESVDGLLLQTGANTTLRIEAADIQYRRRADTSFMPAGLLDDLTPRDWADLYRYLQTLHAPADTPHADARGGCMRPRRDRTA